MNRLFLCGIALFAIAGSVGCGGAIIEPGHRGLFFDPNQGGLRQGVLNPGYYSTSCGVFTRACPRVDDFDVTYSTKKEEIHTTSSEGLGMELRVAVIYRPIIDELYQLDTETGPNYYEEVVGPEFRSAARGVLARHSYMDLQKQNEKIEDEIEGEVRRRIHGKHVEIASITMENIAYAPEIGAAVRAKLVGEQEAARAKAQQENEALKRKLDLEHQAVQDRLKAEQALRDKQNELTMAGEQAQIDKLRAESEAVTRVTHAKAEAEELKLLAKAHAEEKKAETQTLTPLAVMMHAYDALGKMGGEGTHIMLGDFSRTPQFLFPNNGMFPSYGVAPPGKAPVAMAPAAAAAKPATAAAESIPARVDGPHASR